MEGVDFSFACLLSVVLPHSYGYRKARLLYKFIDTWCSLVGFMADGLSERTESTINAVLGFIVVLALLGGTVALVFTNMNTLVTAFENFTSDNATLQALVPIFGLVLGVLIVLGIVKLVRRSTDI